MVRDEDSQLAVRGFSPHLTVHKPDMLCAAIGSMAVERSNLPSPEEA